MIKVFMEILSKRQSKKIQTKDSLRQNKIKETTKSCPNKPEHLPTRHSARHQLPHKPPQIHLWHLFWLLIPKFPVPIALLLFWFYYEAFQAQTKGDTTMNSRMPIVRLMITLASTLTPLIDNVLIQILFLTSFHL